MPEWLKGLPTVTDQPSVEVCKEYIAACEAKIKELTARKKASEDWEEKVKLTDEIIGVKDYIFILEKVCGIIEEE